MGGNNRRYRIKPRFFIFLAAVLVCAGWAVLYALGAFSQPRLEWGPLSNEQTFTAIVVRDEQLVKASDSGQLSCVAAEGGQIKKDDEIAQLYLSGYSEKDIANLTDLQDRIEDYQLHNIIKDTVYKDLDAINAKIADAMSSVSAAVLGQQTQRLAAAEQELDSYMKQRTYYIKSVVTADDTLNQMYQDEQSLLTKVSQTRKSILAPQDGIISFYLDGNEAALSAAAIDKMTPATVKALYDKIAGQQQAYKSQRYVEANTSVCRIVNPAKWYAVIVMSSGENPFVAGVTYDLTFGGLQDTVSGKAVKVLTVRGQTLTVLEVGKGAKEMMSLRLVGGHLGRDIQGFRVPLNMLKEDNSKYYIAVKQSGATVKTVEVTLLGRDRRYAIIAALPGGEELATGWPLIKPR